MTVVRRARIGVMVVVPAFAVADQVDHDVVAAEACACASAIALGKII